MSEDSEKEVFVLLVSTSFLVVVFLFICFCSGRALEASEQNTVKRNKEIGIICQTQQTYIDDGDTKLCVNRGK